MEPQRDDSPGCRRACTRTTAAACPLRAEADQADEVRVAEHRQYQHLHQELLPPLHALSGLLLHRHHLCIGSAPYKVESVIKWIAKKNIG